MGLNLPLSGKDFTDALRTLTHRGPDETNYIQTDNVFLGHTRLSIIGLQNGSQPLSTEDNKIHAVVNGEIYNYRSIRQELEAKGYKFAGDSDSEVVLHLYRAGGVNSINRLRGEFACVIVDTLENKLLAFRDRFGIKPLYYATNERGGLAISSELKGIFATGIIVPEVDPIKIRDFLSLVQHPTIFKNVGAIPARSIVTFDLNCRQTHKPNVTEYWTFDFPKVTDKTNPLSFNELKAELSRQVEQAVKVRLQSDVPLGVYLSGGLDSTVISALAAKHHPTRLNAFSIRFSDVDKFDESEIAKRTAQELGLNYHELEIKQQDILSNLESFLWHAEYPCLNFSGVGKFLLSGLAQKYVKVVLTGEGSDELFMGYDLFRKDPQSYLRYGNENEGAENKAKTQQPSKTESLIETEIGHIPLEEHKVLLSPGLQWFYRKLFAAKHQPTLKSASSVQALKSHISKAETEEREELVQTQIYTINNLLENYNLTLLGDRSEMAHSVEGRPPFLDHHLFEFAKTIPTKYKITPAQSKYILREAMQAIIPKEVYEGKKWPFIAPNYPVIRNQSDEMNTLIATYLTHGAIKELGIFRPFTVRLLMFFSRVFSKNNKVSLQLTALLSLVLSTQIIGITFKQKFHGKHDID